MLARANLPVISGLLNDEATKERNKPSKNERRTIKKAARKTSTLAFFLNCTSSVAFCRELAWVDSHHRVSRNLSLRIHAHVPIDSDDVLKVIRNATESALVDFVNSRILPIGPSPRSHPHETLSTASFRPLCSSSIVAPLVYWFAVVLSPSGLSFLLLSTVHTRRRHSTPFQEWRLPAVPSAFSRWN